MANIRKQLCLELADWLESKAQSAQMEYARTKNDLHRLGNLLKHLKQKSAEANRMAHEFKKQAGLL